MATYEPKKPEQWLREFHEAMGDKPLIERDAFGRQKAIDLRMSLITEEYHEVMDELLDMRRGGGNIEHLAKELADLCVVVIGTADLMEIPFTESFEAVMRSNMSKIQPDGTVIRRADGKVLKPANYRDADMSFLVQ